MSIQVSSLTLYVLLVIFFSFVAITDFNFLIFSAASGLIFYLVALRSLMTNKINVSLSMFFLSFSLIIVYNYLTYSLDIVRISQYLIACGGVLAGYYLSRQVAKFYFIAMVSFLHIVIVFIVSEPVVSTNHNSEFIYMIVLLLILEHGYRCQTRVQKVHSIFFIFFVCVALFYFKCWILFISCSLIAFAIIVGRAFATLVTMSMAFLIFIFILPLEMQILTVKYLGMGYEIQSVDASFKGSFLVRLYGIGFFFRQLPEALLIPAALQGSGIHIRNITSSEYSNVGSFHTPVLTIILELGVYGFLLFLFISLRSKVFFSPFSLLILFMSSFSVSDVYLSNFSYWVCIGIFANWLKQEGSFVSTLGVRAIKLSD